MHIRRYGGARDDFARARTRDTSTADITGGRKNSEEPSVSFRRSDPEAMFDQLVTTYGTWDIVTNSPG